MTLDEARDAFHARPSAVRAATYLAILMKEEEDDELLIGDDTLFRGLAEIRDWLAAQPE